MDKRSLFETSPHLKSNFTWVYYIDQSVQTWPYSGLMVSLQNSSNWLSAEGTSFSMQEKSIPHVICHLSGNAALMKLKKIMCGSLFFLFSGCYCSIHNQHSSGHCAVCAPGRFCAGEHEWHLGGCKSNANTSDLCLSLLHASLVCSYYICKKHC